MAVWRSVLFTIGGLSVYALLLPEVSGGLNSVLSAFFNYESTLETFQKWHVTKGITRDFIDLRESFHTITRNPRSRFLFILLHITAIVPVIVLCLHFWLSKKNIAHFMQMLKPSKLAK